LDAVIEANRAAVRETAPQQSYCNGFLNNLGISL
jgi:hypothetical protein